MAEQEKTKWEINLSRKETRGEIDLLGFALSEQKRAKSGSMIIGSGYKKVRWICSFGIGKSQKLTDDYRNWIYVDPNPV